MRTPLERFYPLIPAGGVGSRLWPLSRAVEPKFLLDLTGTGSSLLRATYDRLVDLAADGVLVVTGQAHANAVTQQLSELRGSDLVLEPHLATPQQPLALPALFCTSVTPRPSLAPSPLTTSSARSKNSRP